MSDSDGFDTQDFADLARTSETAGASTAALGVSATQFAKAMNKTFTDAVSGGKQFDDVLKSLALRLSNLAVTDAFKSLFKELSGGLGGLFGGQGSTGPGIVPFAHGGVIGAPGYFPLPSGGLGLAGEAGPEAVLPLQRGSDGRLGIATSGAASANVAVQIVTPDAASFQRSEAYLTGRIARAVARGQRNL